MNLSQEISIELEKALEFTESIKNDSMTESQKLALGFLRKMASNSRAIVTLYESNLIDEAYAIHRLSIEHLFNISALLRDPGFVDQLISYSQEQIPKALKGIDRDDSNSGELLLTKENKGRVSDLLKRYEVDPIRELGYSIFNAAQKSEISSLYNSRYRQLSLSYAHSTMASLLNANNLEDDDLLTYVRDFLKIAVGLIKSQFKFNRC
jgi:hypothetical protein